MRYQFLRFPGGKGKAILDRLISLYVRVQSSRKNQQAASLSPQKSLPLKASAQKLLHSNPLINKLRNRK